MGSPFTLETIPVTDEIHTCTWCSHPIQKGGTAVRVVDYPAALPENLRGYYFHSMEHLRNWAQQAALNAMRLIATNDPAYLAHPAETDARRDAYSALAQMTFPHR
ncbi:MAG: hypothetical protein ABSA15_04155 [Thermoplasmata archaeon]|jgi:hypothetical protein